MIRKLAVVKGGQPIRSDGPQSHLVKAGTPTMGGALIIASIAVATLLWADLRNRYVWLVLGVTARVRRDRLVRRLPEDRPEGHPGLAAAGNTSGNRCSASVSRCSSISPPTCRRRPRSTCRCSSMRAAAGVRARNMAASPWLASVGVVAFIGYLLHDRRLLQRGQPDRRPRRPGDHADRAGRGRARRVCLPCRQSRVLRIPASRRFRVPASW